MTVRRVGAAALALAAALVLSGCAGDDEVTQRPAASPSAPSASGEGLPSHLVGQWEVTGPGVPARTFLTLAPDEAVAFLECGPVDGSWAALQGGALLVDLYSGDEKCFDDDNPIVPMPAWLYEAASFAVVGEKRELRDAAGGIVAVLSPATTRPPVPKEELDEVQPPTMTAEQRAELDHRPPAFPPGIRPATVADLLGTWVLPGEEGGEGNWPHVTFRQKSFRGTDGCNGIGGRFVLVDGIFLTTDGVSTLIGCENIDITAGAVLLGFDGETLVTFDKDGAEIRRAVRGPAPKSSR